MNPSTASLDDLLKQGIAAAKAGNKAKARELLLLAIEVDDRNETAWLWLSGVVESDADRRVCLENVLTLNPHSTAARKGLRWLDEHAPPAEKCPHCQVVLVGTNSICLNCHKPLIITCPDCAQYVEIDEPMCPHCRYTIGDFRRGATFYLDLVEGYQARQDQRLMIWALDQAAGEAQTHITLLTRIGAWYDRLQQPDRAVALYRQALTVNPDSTTLYIALGQAYQRSGQFVEAYTLYHLGLKRTRNAPAIMVEMGRAIAARDGASHEAFQWVERALQQQPDLAAGHLLLAELFNQCQQPHEALAHYRRVVALAEWAPHEAQIAQQALEQLEPELSTQASGWGELARQMLGLLIIPILGALANAQLRLINISLLAWGAIALSIVGAYLWVSAQEMPRNPLSRLVFGRPDPQPGPRRLAGMLGFSLWLIACIATLLIE